MASCISERTPNHEWSSFARHPEAVYRVGHASSDTPYLNEHSKENDTADDTDYVPTQTADNNPQHLPTDRLACANGRCFFSFWSYSVVEH